MSQTTSIAIIIPCYNEELTIAKVIQDFARELPDATIYVYDNNSSDNTAEIAMQNGAVLRHEPRQGKGNVVRQAFRDIVADYYIMVDGDDTYPAEAVHDIIEPLVNSRADMVIGDRLSNSSYHNENKRVLHSFGNNLVRMLIKLFYGVKYNDVMTGYRGFNRLFVKSFPILSKGFEIETELSIHCIDKNWRIVEIPINYRDRPNGSVSKLSTFSDGVKVLMTIMSLFKDYKPLVLFSFVGILLGILGLVLGITVVIDFAQTGLVERLPSAVLAVAFIIIGLLSIACGLILDTTVKGYRKQYELSVINMQQWSASNSKEYDNTQH